MNLNDLVTFEVNGRKCVALVRKLTETEAGRLMGVSDSDIHTISESCPSRSAQYRMYGNSIVVDVLYHIFKKVFIPSERGDCGITGEWNAENPLRVATLCSGYDSQFMALDRLERDFPPFKYKRVFFSEFDPESRKPIDSQPAVVAHKALYPDCPNEGDMTKIVWEDMKLKYGDIDLLFYSTPCTDISASGLQMGFTEGSGTRSSIIWNVRDALKVLQPRFACMENVSAMLQKKFRPMFDLWRKTTEELGYASFHELLNAKDYGVPQNRNRIFMMSIHREKNGNPEFTYCFPESVPLSHTLMELLDNEVDVKYYLNPSKVQKFVSDNVESIKAHTIEELGRGQTIIPLPERLKEFVKNA